KPKPARSQVRLEMHWVKPIMRLNLHQPTWPAPTYHVQACLQAHRGGFTPSFDQQSLVVRPTFLKVTSSSCGPKLYIFGKPLAGETTSAPSKAAGTPPFWRR
ncbi:hypothetical protein CDV31_017112, partial [Fusarium ambrosium]